MTDELNRLANTNRVYSVETRADRNDGRWYPKGSTRLEPGASVRNEAKRLARVYGLTVRLILKHPAPPPVVLVEAVHANLRRKGELC